jgi:hypothetical protein
VLRAGIDAGCPEA